MLREMISTTPHDITHCGRNDPRLERATVRQPSYSAIRMLFMRSASDDAVLLIRLGES